MLGVINIGEKRDRMRIDRATTSRHETTNETVTTWEELKTIWVTDLGASSKETFEGRQQVAVDDIRFSARWEAVHKAITADMTVITADNAQITADSLYGFVKVVDEKMRGVIRGVIYQIKGIEGSRDKGYVIIKAERRG